MVSCIISGVFFGTAHLIRGVTAQYKQEIYSKDLLFNFDLLSSGLKVLRLYLLTLDAFSRIASPHLGLKIRPRRAKMCGEATQRVRVSL